MKIFLISILSLLIVACGKTMKSYDSRLEGTWVSNKAMTLAALDKTTVGAEMVTFLQENLGDLTFIFKQNKTALLFKESPEIQPNFKEYETIKILESSVIIIPPGGEEITLTYEGDCYYVLTKTNYKEYFCKEV